MRFAMEERQARAERWMAALNARIGSTEPEWWVRMQCGQVAEERSAAHGNGVRRAARRTEKHFWPFVRARPGSAGVEWVGLLSRAHSSAGAGLVDAVIHRGFARFAFPSSGAALPGGAFLSGPLYVLLSLMLLK